MRVHRSSETYQTQATRQRSRFAVGALAVVSTVALSGVTSIGASSIQISSAEPANPPTPSVGSESLTGADAEVFVGVTPFRLVDTRVGTGVDAPGPLPPDSAITVDVAGVGEIPADATSVALNTAFTAQSTSPSFMTIWPSGTPRPLAAANNASPGVASPNFIVSKIADSGSIDVYNERGDAHIVLDVAGYYVPLSSIADDVRGGELWSGEGAPSNGIGSPGDFYIDELVVVMYGPKADDGWSDPLVELGQPVDGSAVLTGNGAPDAADGDVDDLYFDLDAPAAYGPKTDSGWGPAIPIGPDGIGSSVLVESRPPTAADGDDGDLFLDDASLDLYGPKESGDWGTPVSLASGGAEFLVGSGAPADGDGVPGDMYLDQDSLNLHGPKVGGTWGPGIDLSPGSAFLTGAVVPTAGDGVDGDIYLDTTTLTLYGPKAGGVWPSGSELDGPPTASTDSALHAYSNGIGLTVAVASSAPIPFDADGVSVGSAISRVDADTFAFVDAGVYQVSYEIAGDLTVFGDLAVEVDGSPVAGYVAPLAAGASATALVLVDADAGDELEIVLSSLAGLTGDVEGSLIVELIAAD